MTTTIVMSELILVKGDARTKLAVLFNGETKKYEVKYQDELIVQECESNLEATLRVETTVWELERHGYRIETSTVH